MKKGILSTLVLVSTFIAHSQRYIWSPDSISLADPNYAMDRYHDILRYHDPIMYLAYPVIHPIIKRKLPLEDGEGKKGFWMQAQFGHRFVIYQGKYFSYPFLQRMRLTLDANLVSRITKDNSNPLLPFNNKFGFGLDFLFSGLNKLKEKNAGLVWTTFQLHHYSNGQADSFFIDDGIKRNNYRSGDFSTNYFRVLLNIGNSAQEKNILVTSVGFQKDIDLGGLLKRSKELDQYYGYDRLLLQFQWAQKPKLVTANFRNQATAERNTVKVQRRRQIGVRSEFEYIVGDLSNFQGKNKYRLGWHNYITYMPAIINEVGFMAHTYIGRDYLNIRFDDIVFIGALGIYLKFNAR